MSKPNCSHCVYAVWTVDGVKCSFSKPPIDKNGNCTMYKRRKPDEFPEEVVKAVINRIRWIPYIPDWVRNKNE